MPELIFLAPVIFIAYRVLVILLAAWIARPSSRLDLKRFERALSALGHRRASTRSGKSLKIGKWLRR
ncbi:hypothetical protein BH09ACT3_BH09ACT3_03690 [soil metagenome]